MEQGGIEMSQTISDIRTALSPVFDQYGISRAVLFGSVAKGLATEKSDLDLLVDSKLRGLKFVGFMDAVRRTVGMPVDILDVTHIEKGSKIDREITSTGVTIYEK
jgi:predicted nucleotidyltransferase